MKKIIFAILRYSGIPFFIRELVQRNKTSILLFHDIDKNTAQKCFKYLMKKYNIISMNSYVNACVNNEKVSPKSLIITFDDGHIRNYEMLDIIKENDIPLTIFICSDISNTNRNFWFKYEGLKKRSEYYKKVSNKDRLKLLDEIGFKQTKDYIQRQALNKSEIDEMSTYVDFQAHTMFHPCLTQCEFNEAFIELKQSKNNLEKKFGLYINGMAYPNGDYSEKIIELVKKAGYKFAVTTDHGYNNLKSKLYSLKRISTNDTSDLNEFIVRVSGFWGFLTSFRDRYLN